MKPFANLAAKGNCDVRIFEEEIKQRLSGLFLIKIGRTCNMLELTFGDYKSTINEVWHIQSPFRIVCDDRIITSDRDIYIPGNDSDGTFSYCSSERNSVFDDTVRNNPQFTDGFAVTDVKLSVHGDAIIEMQHDRSVLKVECFNNASSDEDDENWRFFRHHSGMLHIVCYRERIVRE